MYGVAEEYILKTWALETLIKKIRHGFRFELMRRGLVGGETTDSEQRDENVVDMMRIYDR